MVALPKLASAATVSPIRGAKITRIFAAVPADANRAKTSVVDMPSDCGVEGELVRKLLDAHTALGFCLASIRKLVESTGGSDARARQTIEKSLSELERANDVLMRLRHRVGCKSRPWQGGHDIKADLMP